MEIPRSCRPLPNDIPNPFLEGVANCKFQSFTDYDWTL